MKNFGSVEKLTNSTKLWLLGAVLTVAGAVIDHVWVGMDAQIIKLEAAELPRVERLSRVEVKVENIEKAVDRVEKKLDAVLEKK